MLPLSLQQKCVCDWSQIKLHLYFSVGFPFWICLLILVFIKFTVLSPHCWIKSCKILFIYWLLIPWNCVIHRHWQTVNPIKSWSHSADCSQGHLSRRQTKTQRWRVERIVCTWNWRIVPGINSSAQVCFHFSTPVKASSKATSAQLSCDYFIIIHMDRRMTLTERGQIHTSYDVEYKNLTKSNTRHTVHFH